MPSVRFCILHSVPIESKPVSTAAEVPSSGSQRRCQEVVTPDSHALVAAAPLRIAHMVLPDAQGELDGIKACLL